MPESVLQALHLVAAPKLDEILRHGSFNSAEHGPYIAGNHQNSANYIWPVFHLKGAAKNFEDGMTAQEIILFSPVEQSSVDATVVTAAHVSKVQAGLLIEPL